MNPIVDFYFDKEGRWQQEIRKLRTIMLDCGLVEALKWGAPTYMFQNRNIVLIHVFKEYCALLFFKGALLQDGHGILIRQTMNVQLPRQVRFTNVREIMELEPILKAYVYEAIEVEKAGLSLPQPDKKNVESLIPEEFQQKLDAKPDLRTAFESLTPGRQRAYILYFSQPKQSKTRQSRIEKQLKRILEGKGLNDL